MQPQWKPQIVEVPITVTLDAYAAEDVVGGVLTSDEIQQFSGGGYIAWTRLVDGACQAEPFDLYVFNALPTSALANDAPFVPLEADWLKCLGQIDIAVANYNTNGTEADMAFVEGKGGTKTNEFVWFDNLPNGRLYFYLVANGSTPDYAAAVDLTMHICVLVM